MYAPRFHQEAKGDDNVTVPGVEADPLLQCEQHPKQRERAYEDDRVQQSERRKDSPRAKRIQWAPFAFYLAGFG